MVLWTYHIRGKEIVYTHVFSSRSLCAFSQVKEAHGGVACGVQWLRVLVEHSQNPTAKGCVYYERSRADVTREVQSIEKTLSLPRRSH